LFISAELLLTSLKDFQVILNDDQIYKFDIFAKMLVEHNKKVNLTAITEPDEIVLKHFADSLALLKYSEIPPCASVADVGTGAGFPGIVLAIARPDLEIAFFDSTKKKLVFVESALKELSLSGNINHMRAEEAGRNEIFREKFDFVTARAVSELNVLAELCIPLVKPEGFFSPMKGALSATEYNNGERAATLLGCKLSNTKPYALPSGNKRTILNFKKISQTSAKYPRDFSSIIKYPL